MTALFGPAVPPPYYVGGLVDLRVLFIQEGEEDVPVDPLSLSFTLGDPAGRFHRFVFRFGFPFEGIYRVVEGGYRFVIPLEKPSVITYAWAGTLPFGEDFYNQGSIVVLAKDPPP